MQLPSKKIIVLGGGGQAKVLIDVLLQLPEYQVVGFLDDNEANTELLGVKRVGKLTVVDQALETNVLALGLGHVGHPDFLKRTVEMYTKAGFSFETIISPAATVSRFAKLGHGVVVAAGAVIQPLVEIADYCIVNTNASVDHDCRVGAFTHIAPGTAISGNVTIGASCLLGTGSRVIQGVKITDGCIVGAGAVVVSDCNESGTYAGVPAVRFYK